MCISIEGDAQFYLCRSGMACCWSGQLGFLRAAAAATTKSAFWLMVQQHARCICGGHGGNTSLRWEQAPCSNSFEIADFESSDCCSCVKCQADCLTLKLRSRPMCVAVVNTTHCS
jgi:hypothetical protein